MGSVFDGLSVNKLRVDGLRVVWVGYQSIKGLGARGDMMK